MTHTRYVTSVHNTLRCLVLPPTPLYGVSTRDNSSRCQINVHGSGMSPVPTRLLRRLAQIGQGRGGGITPGTSLQMMRAMWWGLTWPTPARARCWSKRGRQASFR